MHTFAICYLPKVLINQNDLKSPLDEAQEDQYYLPGLCTHKLLEKIPAIDAKYQEKECLKYLSQNFLSLSKNSINDIINEVMNIIQNPNYKFLFTESSLSELPFTYRYKKLIFNGKIDRVVLTKNEVLIFDYKTNKNVPKFVNNADLSYLIQMSIYYHAISEIYQLKKIKCFFLWTKVPSIMEISENILLSTWKSFLNEQHITNTTN